jgi:hypothetical protein
MGKNPGAGEVPKGYKYTDNKLVHSACKKVIIKNGKQVKALCLGKGPFGLDYDLKGNQEQAPVDVILVTGARRHCMQFGGKIQRDGTNGKIFKATAASAPGACP